LGKRPTDRGKKAIRYREKLSLRRVAENLAPAPLITFIKWAISMAESFHTQSANSAKATKMRLEYQRQVSYHDAQLLKLKVQKANA